jgi:hypothetical protein
MSSVPLNRHFRLIPDAYQKDDRPLGELFHGYSWSENKTWEALFNEYRVVILAEAGAGKTYELQRAAQRLIDQGKAAFFIRIEDIKDSFETAFEIGTPDAFATWLSGAGEAWFFLDSVDEIRLTAARVFEQALANFAARIGVAGSRTHLYVSSRPYAWRPQQDRALIEELLPFDIQTTKIELDQNIVSATNSRVATGRYTTHTSDDQSRTLQLYQLTSLGMDEIRLFAQHSGVLDTAAFLAELERGNLFSLAQLPFDLRDLINTWNDDHALANRLNILQRSVKRQLKDAASISQSLTLHRLEEGAEVLAIAVVLTGVSSIRLQATASEQAIIPNDLLKDWTEAELGELLTSGIFGEPVYGEVRFRHREIRELLAATWINRRLSSEVSRSEIEPWFFRSRYEQTVLSARLRPLLPWLIIFDDSIRERVIAHFPEVVLEGGDATALPLTARESTLTHVLNQITDETSSLRGLDNSSISRIAAADIEPLTRQLIDEHAESDEALFILGRLVWQGKMSSCVEPLASIASNSNRGKYARIVSVRAVGALGSAERFGKLWHDILEGEESIQSAIFAELIAHAPPRLESVEFVLATISRLEPQGQYDSNGLASDLMEFVRRLSDCKQPNSANLLLGFADGMLLFLKQEPHLARGECFVSEEFQWLMPIALQCIEHLILDRSSLALSETSLSILSAVPVLMLGRDNELKDLRRSLSALIPTWHELNDALFWWCIEEYRSQGAKKGERLRDDWPVTWPGHFWAFDETSFARTLTWIQGRELDDQYVALARVHRTYSENGKPQGWLDQLCAATRHSEELCEALQFMLSPQPDPAILRYEEQQRKYKRQHERRQREEKEQWATFVAHLKANPGDVRCPPGLRPDELSTTQFHLLEHLRDGRGMFKRADGADWTALIPEFGDAVAEAYRDAATAFWRAYQPATRSEGAAPNSIPYAVIFGLAGLEIELKHERCIADLTEVEAEWAMRYALWELNGFPSWFDVLCREHPTVVKRLLWTEVEWELSTTLPEPPSFYVLHDLVYHATKLHPDLAPLLYHWMSTHQVLSRDSLRYCRLIITAGGITAAEIAGLATEKIVDPDTPAELLPVWHAIRTDADPALSLPALQAAIKACSVVKAKEFGEIFSVALLGGRQDAVKTVGKFKKPSYLKDLYLLVHRVVRVADDFDRAGKGVYSPTLRDNAQDARERLFGLLSDLPSEVTYRTILELARTHPVHRYRAYMRSRALQRAVADGDIHPWSVERVARAASQLVTISNESSEVGAPHAAN